jgi:hypothetical protein
MNLFAIERNGSLVNHIVFRGDAVSNLYREQDIIPLTFTNNSAAAEIADVLDGVVVDYEIYINTQTTKAA